MKKWRFLAPVLTLSLLCACAGEAHVPSAPPAESQPPAGAPEGEGWTLTACRVVDGAETGDLILAGEDGAIYTLNVDDVAAVTMDGGSSEASALRDGMMVEVGHTGMIQETWPARFDDPKTIAGDTSTVDDRCGLYLQVLEDLWEVDGGLNEGITELGVDLSGLTDLTVGEKHAVAYAFGMAHGILPIEGTWDELAADGYITSLPVPDGYDGTKPVYAGVFYHWEDGCLFAIKTDEDAVWNLPALGPGEEPPTLTAFDAQKWRSSLGAYFFADCTGRMAGDGTWTYSVGAEMIS